MNKKERWDCEIVVIPRVLAGMLFKVYLSRTLGFVEDYRFLECHNPRGPQVCELPPQ